MYVLEHALLNLKKNKGRNILLAVMIFAIITAAVVTLAIFNTTGTVISETRDTLERMVRVAPRHIIHGEETVSFAEFQSFAESEYLVGADIRESRTNMSGVEAIYYLNHPDMLGNFEAELRNRGLPDHYSVVSEKSTFENVTGQLENLQSLSLTFLFIVLVLGAFIMVLLSAISIRERKYEIGVLRAMGMKKKKIAFGLWIEILAITCICFALGMGAGTTLSQPVSDMILSGQADSIHVNVSVSVLTVMQILGVSILLASIAGVISISRITKCEPIKILMERN